MKNVLIRPIITEKMNDLNEKHSQYGFIVDVNANKIEIAKAIKNKFEVDVVKVNTIKNKGKTKSQYTKKGYFQGKTAKFKKAIITLKEGQTIDMFGEA